MHVLVMPVLGKLVTTKKGRISSDPWFITFLLPNQTEIGSYGRVVLCEYLWMEVGDL